MSKNRNKGNNRHVVIMFVRILMTMVPMNMIMMVWCKNLFEDIDDEKSSEECIDSILCLFERLREDMYE